uniref:CR-type domain-containing protein n=1 Tax=Chromera velia CCMP2878 TaxID=1169474 RepID=A0A0G4FZS0_9ALVE|eukprot:Cvel_3982.t1-p1 / transcript=Cvel_3982.t1 / gene=Cvel_3982 / organism=Chromera_velia_CCMP2878 / gene_product=Zinc finger protein 283, putative / transcript_product=Zinc finger protein 283, putative / location=Cvel_scaffold169:21645-23162(+) / protein_length=506 / sequence_SO=supercontig / SO=protein_coding / is_pseudo=false
MGVSGDFVNGVGAGGEGGGVGVSELKFRLLAIPNDGEENEVPHPGNLMCLEPLNGGDFRIVRLVIAPPLAGCSSVGDIGVNTICVGAEGGEWQKREVVGISVEWGVPESVQLALLPLQRNRQTEYPQRESEHHGLFGPQSDIACPPSLEERAQTDSRVSAETTEDRQSKSGIRLSVCPPPPARESRASAVHGGREEEEVSVDHSDSMTVCNSPTQDRSFVDNAITRSDRSNSTHLHSRDDGCGQKEEREGVHRLSVSLKRHRSESTLTQREADECDEVFGCPGERRGGGLWGEGREAGCVREEKQRRLTVSLSDSAPLSSELCRGRGRPMVGRKAVLSENDRRGGEGGEVKRNRHRQILCLHGRVRTRCKECGGGSLCEHGRVRCRCRECGGKSICQHGRERHICKECGGEGICEHGRQRFQCKDCGGKGICEHGRQRHLCKDCGGKGICEHGRRRSQCKDCGGKSICDHGRQRYYCKDCGGGAFCVHRRERQGCQECLQVSFLPP